MLGAYYTKETDSKNIFDNLNISKIDTYEAKLNKYNVISISFNKISDRGNTYDDYIEMIKTTLINDIVEKYPDINPKNYFTISDMIFDTKDKFIFIWIIYLAIIYLKKIIMISLNLLDNF